MEIVDSEVCLKVFSALCEKLGASELAGPEECQYWIFERGYKAALEASADMQGADIDFLETAWSSQPSLDQDFALD